jgi:serine/threonine protein kinase
MTEEQRRTSIRHAGAIEFMAPEQHDGKMLLQTDVYSYAIILYELLTGEVPFPLNGKGETGRNAVMVAHMETGSARPDGTAKPPSPKAGLKRKRHRKCWCRYLAAAGN